MSNESRRLGEREKPGAGTRTQTYEFAETCRHYVKLGLGDRTEIEFFNGPHTINGRGEV